MFMFNYYTYILHKQIISVENSSSDAKNYLCNSNFLVMQLKTHQALLAYNQDSKTSCQYSSLVIYGQENTQM